MALGRRLRWLDAVDEWVVREVTSHPSPALDRWMPRVSRASDHLVVWWIVAGALAAGGGPRVRGAVGPALRAMLLVGPVCNLAGKCLVDRDRPPREVQDRRPGRVPESGSLPSGHTAAAAAFSTALMLRAPAAGAPVAGLAAIVAYSRVYTGAHYPGDVAVGALAGTATAWLLHRWRQQ